MNNGKFIISLDFELMWGVRDKKDIKSYGKNIAGVQLVIPRILELFNKYDTKATFSSVGLLFFDTKKELIQNIPFIKPLNACTFTFWFVKVDLFWYLFLPLQPLL